MPLPVRIDYTDRDGNEKSQVFRDEKDSGYRPSEEYHPTRVIVKCRLCGGVGVAEFVGGFDLKAGDRLMDGKPIVGTCLGCGKTTELIPLNQLAEKHQNELRVLYDIQRTIDLYRRENGDIPKVGVMLPYARAKLHADQRQT